LFLKSLTPLKLDGKIYKDRNSKLVDSVDQLRSQSAMEYLMTYGWSILVIAVVIAVLFTLGVFNIGAGSGANSCIAISGYECSGAVLTSSGILSMSIGQVISGTITLKQIGCTSNSTSPIMQTLFAPVSLSSGVLAAENFSCFSGTKPLGTQFSGYVWIGYSSPDSSAVTVIRVGEIKAAVTTVSSGAPGSGRIAYVPINVINPNTIAATGSSFQQLIFFNPSLPSYSGNESSVVS
jgi:hypothetical protein